MAKIKKIQHENNWMIVPISELPDGKPVLGLSEFPNKSMAEFHLTTHVIIPANGVWPTVKDRKIKEPLPY